MTCFDPIKLMSITSTFTARMRLRWYGALPRFCINIKSSKIYTSQELSECLFSSTYQAFLFNQKASSCHPSGSLTALVLRLVIKFSHLGSPGASRLDDCPSLSRFSQNAVSVPPDTSDVVKYHKSCILCSTR